MRVHPLAQHFDRVYVVNLGRRPDRLEQFMQGLPTDWPFLRPERFAAIDGRLAHPPQWWRQGRGAWGCYRSHVRILEECLNSGVRSALIFEDDAVFGPEFTQRASLFLSHVPDDWEMLYLGGQHLGVARQPPRPVNPYVYQPFNVNRTHAFAVRGESFMTFLYQYLHQWEGWTRGRHIDHHFGLMHQKRERKVYCPSEWLVGQGSGKSNISGRSVNERYWPAAEVVSEQHGKDSPFVAVIGLHSSGSSALAGMLYHLGVHLGNKLGGFYGRNPQKSCGFEAAGLMRVCERIIPFPSVRIRLDRKRIVSQLGTWIKNRKREARRRKTIAGGKYPMLCRLGPYLGEAAGPDLKVVHIHRPLEESIASLIRRCPDRSPDALAQHQRWLWEGKEEFLSELSREAVTTIEYSQLLSDPVKVANQLCDFLRISPPSEKIDRAAAYVDPSKWQTRLKLAAV